MVDSERRVELKETEPNAGCCRFWRPPKSNALFVLSSFVGESVASVTLTESKPHQIITEQKTTQGK